LEKQRPTICRALLRLIPATGYPVAFGSRPHSFAKRKIPPRLFFHSLIVAFSVNLNHYIGSFRLFQYALKKMHQPSDYDG
jgi:hypothetical protein